MKKVSNPAPPDRSMRPPASPGPPHKAVYRPTPPKPSIFSNFQEMCYRLKVTDEERNELEAYLYLLRLRGRLAFKRGETNE